MTGPRVFVTGIGMVSPAGIGTAPVAEALRKGKPGMRVLEAFSTDAYASKMAALVPDFSSRDSIPPMRARRMDRASQMTVVAGRLAVEDAGIPPDGLDGSAVGISIGTGGAGTESTYQFFRALVESGPQAANPMLFPNTVPNAPAGILGIELDLRGPNTTFAQRGNAAEAAIICGARWIRQGRAPMVLAGGVDEISEPFFHGHAVYGVLSPGRMRPYDVARNGYLLGEGASLVVLESEESARSRSARIYGEIAGWGQSTEVRDVLEYPPSADPLVRAMDRALRMAGIRASEIDWISGSANSSRRLDLLETEAARRLFGTGRRIPLSSVKPVFGESLASGGVRLASSLLALEGRFIPPTPGLKDPEDSDGLDLVMGECRSAPHLDRVLQNGAADGGNCVALILRRV